MSAGCTATRHVVLSVLGSWVGVRRPFHLPLFLTAPRMVLPKILVLMCLCLFVAAETGMRGVPEAKVRAFANAVETALATGES